MDRKTGATGAAGRAPRRPLGAWLFMYALFGLCAVLGILQYRAILELSIAARERLGSSLQASLIALSQDLNAEVSSAAHALTPDSTETAQAAEDFVAGQFEHGPQTALWRQLFSRIAIAIPEKGDLQLLVFNQDRRLWSQADWPLEWSGMRNRLGRMPPRGGRGDGPPAPSPRNAAAAFEVPLFASGHNRFGGRGRGAGHGPGPPPASEPRHEIAWLIFDPSIPYVRGNLLPEILQRHLGADYQAEVVTRTMPREVIYRSDPDVASNFERTADAFWSIFNPQGDGTPHRSGPPGMPSGPSGPGPGRGQSQEIGRWLIFVRHRAGSLEAAVSQARWRSMAVTAGVLLMLAATLAALMRYTRRAQKLAELQMEFVAGVSHELRTPVTVIHTAAHNLRGKVAANPAQVERYGALIQQESGRLKDLVEQVLRFAGANAGHVIHERQPLAVETLIDEAILASQPVIHGAGCVVEKRVDANLPAILGDPVALRHALQNLLNNASKYGSGEHRWIGVAASSAGGAEQPAVEIRVSDRGPGIPPEEQRQVFDPFFRGARAVEDQVHGTGLGLSLVRKIVEAHGGSIRLKSDPMQGAEFILRLPAIVAPLPEDRALAQAAERPGAAG
jgi:signal transduction histidine kinase